MKKYPILMALVLFLTACNLVSPVSTPKSDPKLPINSTLTPAVIETSLATQDIPTALSAVPTKTGPTSSIAANTSNLVASSSSNGAFAKLDLYPNIETIGVVVSGANLPKTATLTYRQSNEANWRTGYPLMRIADGRLVSSLFWLSPATSYDIKVTDGTNEISGSITTQPNDLLFTPSNILHVKADAPSGGDGSVSAPFQTIQEGVNHASPGTQVLVADGVYHETVTFPASGSANNWIQVKAEGKAAILDGSENLTGQIWTPSSMYSHVWFTKIGAPIGYLARDQQRFYNYDTLSGLVNYSGHNKVTMNEGWYLQPNTWILYVRSVDNPARHSWQVPRLNHAFDAVGRNWFWIEGFEMRFYGTRTDGCGICTVNSSHVVIRNNKIHNLQLGIFIDWSGGADQGNDTRIESNEIYDPPVDTWPWKAVKGSSMEGTGIVIRTHIGAIVRNNLIHNFNNGIYIGSSAGLQNPEIAFDTDIYNNNIHNIGDDSLEPEGTNINARFRNNTTNMSLTGISLAPITEGPTWVLRNVFSNFLGTSIKWDLNPTGIILIYHNTSWTNVAGLDAMSMISPAHNVVMRNNIFQGNGYAFQEASKGSTGIDWNNDNWYTTRNFGISHFKWENVRYNTIRDLCSATGLECNGYETVPGLANPSGGNFALLPSSPNIDRGMVIPGINDNFAGKAPDVGAFEAASNNQFPTVISSAPAGTNPTNAANVNFTVTFSESMKGVDIVAPFNDFGLTTSSGITGASITGVTPVSGAAYTVNVNTGSGNGIIRLDVIDNDSITNSAGQSLGGAGAGNGNFNTGDLYIVDKTPPTATGIIGTSPNPTVADSVKYAVTFSEPVSGVDTSDFSVFATGGLSGATVAAVDGSGSSYSVTVNTGTGDGTLRLDLTDNDSIKDAAGNPLGGAGTGNGNFSTGEVYTVNKSLIKTITETFTSVGAYDGWVLESNKNSNQGGSTNSTDPTFYLGDNAQDRQFRAILDFPTSTLPDNAVITSATLEIKKLSVNGTDPFATHQNILVDIRAGSFGDRSLQVSDFQAASSLDAAGTILNTPVDNWYSTTLNKTSLPFINKVGITQFRLRFQLANNNDQGADTIKFYSGDDPGRSNRPTLMIEYYLP